MASPIRRDRFLKIAAAGVVAAGAGVVLGKLDDDDDQDRVAQTTPTQTETQAQPANQFGQGDIGIANYALTLEYLEADFYAKAVQSGKLRGKALDLAKRIGENEQEHVDALTAMIKQAGGTPAKRPRTRFPLERQDSILDLAATVENLGASAYLGQADRIKDKTILAAALSIHTVEARHASALNTLTGKSPAPDGAFAKPASMDEVLPMVKPFIVG